MSYFRKVYNKLPQFLKENIKEVYYNVIKKEKFRRFNGYYKTLLSNNIEMITSIPMYFVVKDISNYEQFYTVKEGDVVVDAGANEGYLSIYYAKKVKSKGKILAFEPDNLNLKKFKANLDLNKGVDNISIIEDLIWNVNTKIEFYEAGTVASSAHFRPNDSKAIIKNAITLDTFCIKNNIKRMDFVKMDIEGAEIEALDGAINTIKTFSPNFVIATYHSVNGELTYIKVESFFKLHHYPYKTIFYDDGEILTFAGPCVL